jgi:hypothetical protein
MFNPINFDRGEEFDQELKLMAERARGFDSKMVYALWRILSRFNFNMEQALKGNRDCEKRAGELVTAVEDILPPPPTLGGHRRGQQATK